MKFSRKLYTEDKAQNGNDPSQQLASEQKYPGAKFDGEGISKWRNESYKGVSRNTSYKKINNYNYFAFS